jgi:hypothetical protein
MAGRIPTPGTFLVNNAISKIVGYDPTFRTEVRRMYREQRRFEQKSRQQAREFVLYCLGHLICEGERRGVL